MSDIDIFRNKLIPYLQNHQQLVESVESVTIVGSFLTSDNIEAFSDIDTIIIVDELTKSVFDKIIEIFQSLPVEEFGLKNYTVIINSSFGPLKYNQPNSIVFHVMIYDLAGHRKHVIESPFTCYEWQQYKSIVGKNLIDIYPSNALTLDDITKTRRGFLSYLEDLEQSVISYRSYHFKEDGYVEIKKQFELDPRHKDEYGYHILKYLMANILKIIYQKPIEKVDETIASRFSQLDNSLQQIPGIFDTVSVRKKNITIPSENNLQLIRSQMLEISNWYQQFCDSLPIIHFYRHLPTELNDGTFLGVGRDPDIKTFEIASNVALEIIYCSELKRTISTARLLHNCGIVRTSLLNEINYGEVEGMTYNELQKNFPEIINAWNSNEDPSFPGGENIADVVSRLETFLHEHIFPSEYKNVGVVTHNVVIRVLLSKLYAVPAEKSYRFNIPHGEKITCRLWNKTLIPVLTEEQRIRYREEYLPWNKRN